MDSADKKWERLRELNEAATQPRSVVKRSSVNLKLLAIGYNTIFYSIVVQALFFISAVPLALAALDLPDLYFWIWAYLWIFSTATLFLGASLILIARHNILAFLGLFIPFVNLAIVYYSFGDAKQELLINGVPVGFFGAKTQARSEITG